jgi:hypothetical protein
MFCSGCGMGIPDEAAVCVACGRWQWQRPVPCVQCAALVAPGATSCPACGEQAPAHPYEYCEIRITVEAVEPSAVEWLIGRPSVSHRWRFWADAAGPDCVYSAGESEWIAGPEPQAWDSDLHDDFVARLQAEGWELLVESGKEWWSMRFRRRRPPPRLRS